MVLIITSWLVLMLIIFCSCSPFKNYWQIHPDPGNYCQPGISTSIIWSQFVMNVFTDLFLLFIPMPMLWKSSLHFYKKIATTVVLSAGVFIVICALLKIIYVNTVSNTFKAATKIFLHEKSVVADPVRIPSTEDNLQQHGEPEKPLLQSSQQTCR